MSATRAQPIAALAAGALYFLIMFAFGFALGTVRVVLLAPALGELLALLTELPVMLSLSWIASRRIVRNRPALSGTAPRLTMGIFALTLLICAEFVLADSAFGLRPGAYLMGYTTLVGLLGLTGQLAFALFPWVQYRTGHA